MDNSIGGSVTAKMIPGHSIPDLAEGMDSRASSLTDVIHTGDRSTKIPGEAYWHETYIHFRWPWIILPTAAVIFSIVFFIATMLASRKLHVVLWKSSDLPWLMYWLETESGHGFDFLWNVDEVQHISKIKVIAKEDQGSLLLSKKLAD